MPAGAPQGNQNARKGKLWNQALERALQKRGRGDMVAELDRLAEKFLDAIEEMTVPTEKRGPNVSGFAELADRLDGKANQAIELSGEVGSYVARTPNVSPNASAWAQTHAPAAACDSQPSKE